jgi:hypothetical protein
MNVIQLCFICRPSDSKVSEDAGIEPRTVATFAWTARRSKHSARSHLFLSLFNVLLTSCLINGKQTPILHENLSSNYQRLGVAKVYNTWNKGYADFRCSFFFSASIPLSPSYLSIYLSVTQREEKSRGGCVRISGVCVSCQFLKHSTFFTFCCSKRCCQKIISDQSEQMLMSRATAPANRNGVCSLTALIQFSAN